MMDRDEQTHMVKHAAWLAHQALCPCDLDSPPILDDMARIGAALPYLEERIRADERARIAAALVALRDAYRQGWILPAAEEAYNTCIDAVQGEVQ